MYKSEQDGFEAFVLHDELILEDIQNLNWDNNTLLLHNQEDTMDAGVKYGAKLQEFIPTSPIGPPDRTIFAGDLKFEVEICGAHTNKSKYLYSHRLNRIYVDMGYSFSVQFKWDVSVQPLPDMYVRATTVFCDQAQAEKRVTRCIQHYHDTSKNGAEASEVMRLSVLHSARGAGTQEVFYCGGGGDAPDYWLSVLVRLPAPTTHAYQFTCKNSCSSGINRRTIAIIFTLEDFTGKVYGRQSVGARVCSCPKRDITREEAEAPRGKRPLAATTTNTNTSTNVNTNTTANNGGNVTAPKPKKIRMEVVGTDALLRLPPMTVVGHEVYNTGLRVMISMMEEKRAWNIRHHASTEDLDTSIAHLKSLLEKNVSQT